MNDDQAYQVATAALQLAGSYPDSTWARHALNLVYDFHALDAAGRREHWELIVGAMTPAELQALAEVLPHYWPIAIQAGRADRS